MQLIEEWLRGERGVRELSRGYGLSRKRVYKWIGRYQEEGDGGLQERLRDSHHCEHAVATEVVEQIVATKRAHLSFGPKKVMDYCARGSRR